jgi:response regulator RpfG family c-di-GMP phosphodiesterase
VQHELLLSVTTYLHEELPDKCCLPCAADTAGMQGFAATAALMLLRNKEGNMPVPLQVDSETAEKLRQMAQAQKVSVEELLATYVPGLDVSRNTTGETSDPVQEFEQWVAEFPTGSSPLSDEAVSRASVYSDR